MSEALRDLRSLMSDHNLQAYFLPHNDFHNSEYLGKHDHRVEFISGFKGSNSQILITQSEALLWTDGRYWLAAVQELYPEWKMMKMSRSDPSVFQYISQTLPKDSRIGFDPSLISSQSAERNTSNYLKSGYHFVPIHVNLVNQVWKTRPEISQNPVFVHEIQYAGRTVSEKLAIVESKFSEKYYFTSVLDDIAWLLNLRGSDIDYNPLFFSYLLIDRTVSPTRLFLFVHRQKVESILDYLESVNVVLQSYDEVALFLQNIEEKVVVDSSELNFSLYNSLKNRVHKDNVIARVKSVKTEREINGFIESHKRDAVALVKYFAWLEGKLKRGEELNEWTAALHLDDLRSQQELNKGLSFENISSSGPNAAIIHYAPTAEKARNLSLNEIYLLDSGGQYLDGTVDTTRTMHFGKPTDWEKECYTRVLLGNLDLERVKWPKQSRLTGNDFDTLARRWLWEAGLDYNHGTGHGVGYYLNVHEGPQYLCLGGEDVFTVGMNITNEPGYYEEGKFGIRIENVLFVQVSEKVPGFLEFLNVTVVPYDKNLIDFRLTSKADLDYINEYHKRVFDTIGPKIQESGDAEAYEWLIKATSPIDNRIV